MKNFLIGITIGGAAIVTVYLLSKKNKTYIDMNQSETEEEVKETKKDVVEKKVKEAGEKMANWILEHKDYIEAGTAVVGFVASLFSLRNAVKPRKPKGAMILSNKEECDKYFTSVFKDAKKDILNDFFDDVFESGGQTITNSDGERQLIITTRRIGEAA